MKIVSGAGSQGVLRYYLNLSPTLCYYSPHTSSTQPVRGECRMAPVPNELLIELRNIFRERFNLSDLSDLCQELGIDIENLPGTSRNEKARELAAYLGRRDMVGKLAVVGPKSYPDVPWLEILGRYGYAPPAPNDDPLSVAPPAQLTIDDLRRLVPVLAQYPEFNAPGSRQNMLTMADVLPYLDVDVAGSPRQVANAVLLRLNDRGEIAPGDTALGRLLAYLLSDDTLPQSARTTISEIVTRYQLGLAS